MLRKEDIEINIAMLDRGFEYKMATNLSLLSTIAPSELLWVEERDEETETGCIYRVLSIDTYLADYKEHEKGEFVEAVNINVAKYIGEFGGIHEIIISYDKEVKICSIIPKGDLLTETMLISRYRELKQSTFSEV